MTTKQTPLRQYIGKRGGVITLRDDATLWWTSGAGMPEVRRSRSMALLRWVVRAYDADGWNCPMDLGTGHGRR